MSDLLFISGALYNQEESVADTNLSRAVPFTIHLGTEKVLCRDVHQLQLCCFHFAHHRILPASKFHLLVLEFESVKSNLEHTVY